MIIQIVQKIIILMDYTITINEYNKVNNNRNQAAQAHQLEKPQMANPRIFPSLHKLTQKVKEKLLYLSQRSISSKKHITLTFLLIHIPLIYLVIKKNPQQTTIYVSNRSAELSQVSIPPSMRRLLFGMYASWFGVDKGDMVKDMQDYQTFREFFTRNVKERQIEHIDTQVLAPVDAKILSIKQITQDQCTVIKGFAYSLGHLLCGQDVQFTPQQITSIKRTPSNKLYQATFYLSPGDYHHLHSPLTFTLSRLKSIQGSLFSVSQPSLLRLRKVYQLNSRLILHGKWSQGYLGLVMVGALNVGGIHVRDRGGFGKGEEVGYFSMGSTVVMLLEAKGLEWKVKQGDKVRYGQVLAETIL